MANGMRFIGYMTPYGVDGLTALSKAYKEVGDFPQLILARQIIKQYLKDIPNPTIQDMREAVQKLRREHSDLALSINHLYGRHINPNAQDRKRNVYKCVNGSHTIEEWENKKKDYGYRCYYCGQPRKLAKDHIIPKSSGGSDNIDNIVPSCKSCNSKKHVQEFNQFKNTHPLPKTQLPLID